MSDQQPGEVTRLLHDWGQGNEDALEELMPVVYAELKKLARRYLRDERPGHTLQSTALVNEAYLRLVDQNRVSWQNRAHFFGVAAQAMRRILVDHARKKKAAKRGGGEQHVTFDDAVGVTGRSDIDLLTLDACLTELSEKDPRQGRIIELKYFVGLNNEETAEVLGVSVATIKRDWNVAKAWPRREMLKDK